MSWMVTMLVGNIATAAKVKVITHAAGDKLMIWKTDNAVVAGAECAFRLLGQCSSIISECSRHVPLSTDVVGLFVYSRDSLHRDGLRAGLGRETLCGAGDDVTINDGALDQPMTFTTAELAVGDTGLTEVVVAILTQAAMEVDVVHCDIALVAVDRPSRRARGLFGAQSELVLLTMSSKSTEEVWACQHLCDRHGTNKLTLAGSNERVRNWGFISLTNLWLLLGRYRLAELEDARADGALVKGGGASVWDNNWASSCPHRG